MLIGVIADDFTGASDIANTLAKGLPGQGGLRTAQYLGVPDHAASRDVDAGVVSLKSRSIPAGEAVAQSLDALRWLLAQGCEQIVLKYCSTFDSTPEGNIGPVGEALAGALGVCGVVVCPAFPAAGRTLYQGHLFVHDRLLNESGMEHHPLNPMSDADIRRWLRRQTTSPVGLVCRDVVRRGPAAVRDALAAAAAKGETLAVVDAIEDEDLVTIARAVAEAKLVTGGSGIALGLPANFLDRGRASVGVAQFPSVGGPEAILVGSCSGATRGQVEHHAKNHPVLAIDVDAVMAGSLDAAALSDFLLGHAGKAPLVYSSGSPQEVKRKQDFYGRERLAHRLDLLFAQTALRLVAGGVRRLVVAGGETSGAVVSALDLGALRIGPEIDPGVPVLVSEGLDPIGLALKSGNFGAVDFFTKALVRIEGQ